MIAAKSYGLWYVGAAQHELLDTAKRQLSIDTAKAYLDSGTITGKQMAEKFLNMLQFDKDVAYKVDSMTIQANEGKASVTDVKTRQLQELDHVHINKSSEIRSTWGRPQITDKQLHDALFTDLVEPLLDEIPKEIPIEIGIGYSR